MGNIATCFSMEKNVISQSGKAIGAQELRIRMLPIGFKPLQTGIIGILGIKLKELCPQPNEIGNNILRHECLCVYIVKSRAVSKEKVWCQPIASSYDYWILLIWEAEPLRTFHGGRQSTSATRSLKYHLNLPTLGQGSKNWGFLAFQTLKHGHFPQMSGDNSEPVATSLEHRTTKSSASPQEGWPWPWL